MIETMRKNQFNKLSRFLLITPTIISILLVLARLVVVIYERGYLFNRYWLPLMLVSINAYAIFTLILKQKRLLGVYVLVVTHMALLVFLLLPDNYLYPFFDWYNASEYITYFAIKGILFAAILQFCDYGQSGWEILITGTKKYRERGKK